MLKQWAKCGIHSLAFNELGQKITGKVTVKKSLLYKKL